MAYCFYPSHIIIQLHFYKVYKFSSSCQYHNFFQIAQCFFIVNDPNSNYHKLLTLNNLMTIDL